MAGRKNIAQIKPNFETGDVPTQEQYYEWLESSMNESSVGTGTLSGGNLYGMVFPLAFNFATVFENPFWFRASATNTGAIVHLNFPILGEQPELKNFNGNSLVIGDIVGGAYYMCIYNEFDDVCYLIGDSSTAKQNLLEVLQQGSTATGITTDIIIGTHTLFSVGSGTSPIDSASFNSQSLVAVGMHYSDGVTNNVQSIVLGGNAGEFEGIKIRDVKWATGAFYPANYIINGIATHGDRWIPDYGAVKAYADSKINGTVNTFPIYKTPFSIGDSKLSAGSLGQEKLTWTAQASTLLVEDTVSNTEIELFSTRQIRARDTATGFEGFLKLGTVSLPLTASRSWDMPDETGTVALKTDTNYQKFLAPVQIVANQNDYNPTGWGISINRLELTSDANRDITGLSAGGFSRKETVLIINEGNFNLKLKKEDGNSLANNRFRIQSDLTIEGGESVLLIYSVTSSRWIAITTVT